MENILVPETQEDQSDDPNLVLEGDDWLEWIMFSVGRYPVLPETQVFDDEKEEGDY